MANDRLHRIKWTFNKVNFILLNVGIPLLIDPFLLLYMEIATVDIIMTK